MPYGGSFPLTSRLAFIYLVLSCYGKGESELAPLGLILFEKIVACYCIGPDGEPLPPLWIICGRRGIVIPFVRSINSSTESIVPSLFRLLAFLLFLATRGRFEAESESTSVQSIYFCFMSDAGSVVVYCYIFLQLYLY